MDIKTVPEKYVLVTGVVPVLKDKAPSYTGSYPDISGMTDEPTEVMPAFGVPTAKTATDVKTHEEDEAIGRQPADRKTPAGL